MKTRPRYTCPVRVNLRSRNLSARSLLNGDEQTLARAVDSPFGADIVAKVGDPLHVRNFRIQPTCRLNQSCAANPFIESILRGGMRKIFLQQYLPVADSTGAPVNRAGGPRRSLNHGFDCVILCVNENYRVPFDKEAVRLDLRHLLAHSRRKRLN